MKKKIFLALIFINSFLFSYMAPVAVKAEEFNILDEQVTLLADKYPHLSVYYHNLVTDQSYSYQSDQVVSAASTIKLPYVMYVYELAAKNEIDLNEELTYKSRHYYEGSGIIQHDKIGTTYTIKDLVEKSVVYSDNIAFNMLRERVGHTNFIAYAKSIGGTVVYPNGRNLTTAKDLAIYLRHLWDFSKKYPDLGNELLNLLKNTIYTDTVAKSVNPQKVAHKVGYLPLKRVYNDAAIVSDEYPYILVVMTQGIPVGTDVKLISNLADIVEQEHRTTKAPHFVSLLWNAEKSNFQFLREIAFDYDADEEADPYQTFHLLNEQFSNAQSAYEYLDEKDQEKYSERLQNVERSIKNMTPYMDLIQATETQNINSYFSNDYPKEDLILYSLLFDPKINEMKQEQYKRQLAIAAVAAI